MKRVLQIVAAGGLGLATAGCHSAYVEAVVINHTTETLSLVEVDYPSASFGTENMAPGAQYSYRFKVLGAGTMKVLWTDAKRQDHTADGPELHDGDEGGLAIEIEPGGTVGWRPSLKK